MNTSLTESFGIGMLEAACAGLYVMSTRVGGVPEILPEDMISFANPEEDGAYSSICLLCAEVNRIVHGFRCPPRYRRGDQYRFAGKARSRARTRARQDVLCVGGRHGADGEGV